VSELSASRLVPLVTEAGELARRYFRHVTPERKPDRTLVTEADRAVEEFLVQGLRRLAPAARILGEEFGVAGHPDAPQTITVDPIDGTAAFVAGLPTWCVTLGLVSEGRALGGVTHLPTTGETYLAEHGHAFWNGRVIAAGPRPVAEGDRFIVADSGFHRSGIARFPGKVRSLGSTAYHMALVVRGAAVAAFLGRPHIWDIAAGAALLDAIGGDLCTRSGAPVDLGSLLGGERVAAPLVAAAPGMRDEILAMLSAPA
jgi:myo-inositol-1(or 4)-monophosphatase